MYNERNKYKRCVYELFAFRLFTSLSFSKRSWAGGAMLYFGLWVRPDFLTMKRLSSLSRSSAGVSLGIAPPSIKVPCFFLGLGFGFGLGFSTLVSPPTARGSSAMSLSPTVKASSLTLAPSTPSLTGLFPEVMVRKVGVCPAATSPCMLAAGGAPFRELLLSLDFFPLLYRGGSVSAS